MRLALTVFAVLALALVSAAIVEVTASEFVPAIYSKSPTGRLLKRSFCNTFGGCGGSKRSFEAARHSNYRMGDDANEERRNDADAKIASEILEDIMDHLKRDESNRQVRYFVLGPNTIRKGDSASQHSSFNGDGSRQDSRGSNIPGLDVETSDRTL